MIVQCLLWVNSLLQVVHNGSCNLSPERSAPWWSIGPLVASEGCSRSLVGVSWESWPLCEVCPSWNEPRGLRSVLRVFEVPHCLRSVLWVLWIFKVPHGFLHLPAVVHGVALVTWFVFFWAIFALFSSHGSNFHRLRRWLRLKRLLSEDRLWPCRCEDPLLFSHDLSCCHACFERCL